MATSHGGFQLIDSQHVGDDKIMFGANGVNSCVQDLLVFYKAMLDASEHSDNDNPFKNIEAILSGHMPASGPSLLERSYALGWHRSQLPNTIAGSSMNGNYVSDMPVLCRGSKSQLAFYHGGHSTASQNWVIMLPETKSVIVVLTNTMGNGDASNWVASLILETLVDSPEKHNIVAIAETASKRATQLWVELHEKMEKGRIPDTTHKPAAQYVAKHWNHVGNWHMDIYLEQDSLRMAFQGDRQRSHVLTHYHHDVFTWLMTQDENMKHGRFPYTSSGQWLIKFQIKGYEVVGL
ncbi:hypothetical protein K505DRAFT_363968 [Melanomma pulvis-pyrius CBS 109.77]|uniref:Beta-lactamase/transpeptidase-like protein n=1 Tax=Melanomma pulvis-pyrius CBS 109.77 TaxID=1314802 RepID=A0A6A6X565_9PLEO|nr:hypothetical protein K505DRAFT_363968 [Melanomma pulvis-pyrius CBS 109.77]